MSRKPKWIPHFWKQSEINQTLLCFQYFLGVIVVTPSILAGMSLSYSAVASPVMNLDVSQTSWFCKFSIYSYFHRYMRVKPTCFSPKLHSFSFDLAVRRSSWFASSRSGHRHPRPSIRPARQHDSQHTGLAVSLLELQHFGHLRGPISDRN